ncbi:hypothetical protein RND81_10G104600 [Saponaria officinalis]|uniref:CHASE domain-containing protein n=1 Tax=Saponaria officinalis TaxID=3572 RepID=A0AAW1I0K2_SAPOF
MFLLLVRVSPRMILKSADNSINLFGRRNLSASGVGSPVHKFQGHDAPVLCIQKTFARYTDRTAFERPLTSGVAYAVRVLLTERESFEKQQGWTIKRMDEENTVQEDDFDVEKLEPSPVQKEYAPVIFGQDTIAHMVSVDLLTGKDDRENVLCARAAEEGVLTAPFPLFKSSASPEGRLEATDGA